MCVLHILLKPHIQKYLSNMLKCCSTHKLTFILSLNARFSVIIRTAARTNSHSIFGSAVGTVPPVDHLNLCKTQVHSRHLQTQCTVNRLQQAAFRVSSDMNFPNLYIPTAQHSWFTKIEIIKSQLSGSCASLSVGV